MQQKAETNLKDEFLDLYSGFAHLLTNTLKLISDSIITTILFILYHTYSYVIYVIFKVPRPVHYHNDEEEFEEEIPKPPPVFDQRMLRRRQYAIDELITSEYKYHDYLQLLVDTYEPAFKDFLTYEDRVLFFGSIHPLIDLSENVASIFESQVKMGAKLAEIGNLFLKRLNLVSKFVPFISNYLEIISRFNSLCGSDKKFLKLNSELDKEHEPFTALIVMPVQRMPKYVLLLREISKATPDWHPDYQPLQDAINKLNDEAKDADKSIAEGNRRCQLVELERSIRKCPPLLDDKRRFISRFELTEERTELILLSDMLIITKEKSETLSRKTYIEIKKLIDLRKVEGTEALDNGVNLKTIGADYLIEITDRLKELQDLIDRQIIELSREIHS